MFSGINPKKMQAMMKQMGISQQEINASRVVIEKREGGKITIENPSVTRIIMQGQDTFQVVGDHIEESTEENEISEEDIETIVKKTGVSEEEAREALERTGDLAEAILELSE
jgi:nascent polypeptide-associated complex subunit alpha